MEKALQDSKKSAAPGGSGWRRDHLFHAVLYSDPASSDKLKGLLYEALKNLERGVLLPAQAVPYYAGGVLTALSKSPTTYRPIAVGEFLRRLLGKAIALENSAIFKNYLFPHGQLGVAVAGGVEAIPHAVRIALAADPSLLVLQLDFKNAFNTVDRNVIYQQLETHFPHLIPYFLSHYGVPSRLGENGGKALIWSETGVQQGDPLGPFFFSLALQAVRDGAEPLQLLLDLAYLDDIVLCGSAADVAERLAHIVTRLAELNCGLELNLSKCVLWSPTIPGAEARTAMTEALKQAQRKARLAEVPIFDFASVECPGPDQGVKLLADKEEDANDGGIKLLGGLIGPEAWVATQAKKINAHAKQLTAALGRIKHLQSSILLLRYCAVPGIAFFLRTSAPSAMRTAAHEHSWIMINSLTQLQGFTPPEAADGHLPTDWVDGLYLPKGMGGMGLMNGAHLAELAFLSSVGEAAQLFLSPQGKVPFAAIGKSLARWQMSDSDNGTPPLLEADEAAATQTPANPFLDGVTKMLADFINTVSNFRRDVDPSLAESMWDDGKLLPQTVAQLVTTSRKLQRRLTNLHAQMQYTALLGRLSVPGKAMRLSLKEAGASAPLEMIPSCPELTMSNDAFRTFLFAYQMIPVIQFEAARAVNDDGTQVQPEGGIQFLEETFSCHCHGENAQTRSAGHIFHCARTKGMDVRHNELGREVIEMIRSVNATTTAQLLHVPGTPMVPRPDIAVSGLPRGEQAWVEVSCINQLQGGRVGMASQRPLSAAAYAEVTKLRKYSRLAWNSNRHLFVAVMESASGTFGKGMLHLIKACELLLNKAVFEESEQDRTWASNTWSKYWRQRLSASFWRGTTQMIFANYFQEGVEGQSYMSGGTGDWDLLDTDNPEGSAPLPQMPGSLSGYQPARSRQVAAASRVTPRAHRVPTRDTAGQAGHAGAGRQEGMEEEARGAGEMGEAGQEEVEVRTSQDGPVAVSPASTQPVGTQLIPA